MLGKGRAGVSLGGDITRQDVVGVTEQDVVLLAGTPT